MEITTIKSFDERDNLTKIKFYDRNTNINALVLGKLISENILNEYWKKLGYDSFGDFVAQSNLSFTKRTAYNYIDLWKLFCKFTIDMDKFTEIPYSKLLKIKDVITEDNLEEWLSKAKELSRSDLELELEENKALEAGKPFIPRPKVYLCPDCHKWVIWVSSMDICVCGKSMIKGEDILFMNKKAEADKFNEV